MRVAQLASASFLAIPDPQVHPEPSTSSTQTRLLEHRPGVSCPSSAQVASASSIWHQRSVSSCPLLSATLSGPFGCYLFASWLRLSRGLRYPTYLFHELSLLSPRSSHDQWCRRSVSSCPLLSATRSGPFGWYLFASWRQLSPSPRGPFCQAH